MKKIVILSIILLSVNMAQAEVSQTDFDSVLNWAEEKYPEILSLKNSTTVKLDPYYYRYYPSTNFYVAVSTADDYLYTMDGNTLVINKFAPFADYLALSKETTATTGTATDNTASGDCVTLPYISPNTKVDYSTKHSVFRDRTSYSMTYISESDTLSVKQSLVEYYNEGDEVFDMRQKTFAKTYTIRDGVQYTNKTLYDLINYLDSKRVIQDYNILDYPIERHEGSFKTYCLGQSWSNVDLSKFNLNDNTHKLDGDWVDATSPVQLKGTRFSQELGIDENNNLIFTNSSKKYLSDLDTGISEYQIIEPRYNLNSEDRIFPDVEVGLTGKVMSINEVIQTQAGEFTTVKVFKNFNDRSLFNNSKGFVWYDIKTGIPVKYEIQEFSNPYTGYASYNRRKDYQESIEIVKIYQSNEEFDFFGFNLPYVSRKNPFDLIDMNSDPENFGSEIVTKLNQRFIDDDKNTLLALHQELYLEFPQYLRDFIALHQ